MKRSDSIPDSLSSIQPPALSRRGFARTTLVAPAVLAAVACGDDDGDGPGTKVATLDELEAHAPVAFELPDGLQGFVVALRRPAAGGIGPDGSIVAFSSVCPHMGCPIAVETGVDVDRGRFGPCLCHHSVFDLTRDGRMLHGRASSNLSRIELTIVGREVYARAATRLAFGQPLTEATALTPAGEGEVSP